MSIEHNVFACTQIFFFLTETLHSGVGCEISPRKKRGEKCQRSSEARGNDLTTREAMSSDIVVYGGFFKTVQSTRLRSRLHASLHMVRYAL